MANAYDDLLTPADPTQNGPKANAYADLMPQADKSSSATQPATDQGDWVHQVGRQAGLAGRAVINAVAGIPEMAADVGVSTRNLAYNLSHGEMPKLADFNPFATSGGSHYEYELPSHSFNQGLTALGLPEPQNRSEAIAGALMSMVAGSKVPNPEVAGAPANFVTPAQQQSQRLAASLQKSQEQGFVVPPSTTNPSWFNKTLETIGGKEATQNQARVINQTARNAAAANDLGLRPEVFTPEAVAAVKQEAGQGFEAARTIPTVKTDSQYVDDLTKVLQTTHGSNSSFPGSANPDAARIVDTYLQPEFTGDSAVSALKQLRTKASDAYRTGNSELGMTYKGVAGALESQLERGAQNAGGPYTDLVSALRQSRQTYAKASTIEDAMSPQGDVSGQKLAAAWKRGEPLSGGTLTAAEHAVNYPKANLPANSSNISHLNMYGAPALSLLAEHATGSPFGLAAGAALPLVRSGARSTLLSEWGQAGALPGRASKASALAKALSKPSVMAAGYNASAGYNANNSQ
jgi:hypothetical protein